MNLTRSPFSGQSRQHDTFMHRLDARPKIILVLLIMVLSFLSDSSLFYLQVLVLVAGLQFWSGMTLRRFVTGFRPMIIGVVITLLFHLLFGARSGRVIFSMAGIDIYSGGLEDGIFYSLRLLMFVTVMIFLTSTTSPSQLAESASYLIMPLRRFGVKVNDVSLILFMAIRFIPILADEYTSIRNAQMMRGVRFDGSLPKRIARSVSLMLPIFLTSLTRADDLALAIEVRGYHSTRLRTIYSHTKFGWHDIGFIIISSSLIVIMYWLTGHRNG